MERRSGRSQRLRRSSISRLAGRRTIARWRSLPMKGTSRTSSTSPTRVPARRARSPARRPSKALPGCPMAPVSCMRPRRAARSGTRRFSICAPCRGTGATIGSSRSAKCSYVDPEIVQPGKIFASRIHMQSDIWRFPISGLPLENVRNATRLTRQTAQVQTPSPSPDGKQIAYLSNSGGQGNVWVANTDGSGTARSLTTESDPSVVVGLPLWSPTSDWIVYIKTRAGQSSSVADPIGWQRSPSAHGPGHRCGLVSRWPLGVLQCVHVGHEVMYLQDSGRRWRSSPNPL